MSVCFVWITKQMEALLSVVRKLIGILSWAWDMGFCLFHKHSFKAQRVTADWMIQSGEAHRRGDMLQSSVVWSSWDAELLAVPVLRQCFLVFHAFLC